MLDYETLRLIWWVLLGVLLIGFAATDGFDMGVGAMARFIGRTDIERRIAINTIGPVWEGNQVWFVLGGGAIFAAWPALYALSFSGFYLAMFAVLFAFILRPVAFKYRSKIDNPQWRNAWDWALCVGSAIPMLIFGVAVGNTLQGVPFHFTDDLRPIYEGSFFGLLNPLALYCGLVSFAMLLMHGASWLAFKADEPVAGRAAQVGLAAAAATAVLFAGGGLLTAFGAFGGYAVLGAPDFAGPSNPLYKAVVVDDGAWMANFADQPLLWIVPALGVGGAAIAALGFIGRRETLTFLASMAAQAGIIGTVGVSMFPFILPSSTNPDHSLMVFDASSSELTLAVMLGCTVVFLPIVLAYTGWVYHVLRGKVTAEQIEAPHGHAY